MTIGTRSKRRNSAVQQPAEIRVAAYARISVADRDAAQFSSIQAQVEAITAYIQSHKADGWELAGEPYVDDGYSGATTNRPALERVLRPPACVIDPRRRRRAGSAQCNPNGNVLPRPWKSRS